MRHRDSPIRHPDRGTTRHQLQLGRATALEYPLILHTRRCSRRSFPPSRTSAEDEHHELIARPSIGGASAAQSAIVTGRGIGESGKVVVEHVRDHSAVAASRDRPFTRSPHRHSFTANLLWIALLGIKARLRVMPRHTLRLKNYF